MFNPLQAALAACFGLFYICVMLIIRLQAAKKAALQPEVRYIDTTGIVENPPRIFMEVWQGKTLNFKFEKYDIIIPMVSIREAVNFISKISSLYLFIDQLTDGLNASLRLSIGDNGKLTKLQELKMQLQINVAYKLSIGLLYNLSIKKITGSKSKYKKALYRWCKDNYVWTMDVLEQINDYWQTVERKKKLLIQGQTLKQMDGVLSTWQDLTLDKHGNKLIVPRYG